MKAVLCLSLSFFVVAIVGELITPKALTREIRADVLRDFPGVCYASTQCRTFKEGEEWDLKPFCGKSVCTKGSDGTSEMAAGMSVYLMIRRKKTTIFTDAKETTNVSELKKIIQGITKVSPENQRLFREDRIMEDNRCLADYGLISTTARAQCPAALSLTYRMDNGDFEPIDITPLSSPPELPDVMKGQEATHDTSSN
uniref:Elongin-B n=1 Tax=Moina brachiata TaxID=675436 RepID=A0A4Y7NJH0_9CRUS|nr:EOG090X0JP1 [Moina brachiata]SVE93389.1 EOG090X0JP1 [Moina brachiata]